MKRSMLTTVDNPHDPFDAFPAWYAWDVAAGYHTTEYLARIVATSDELSEWDQQMAIEDAIDEIMELNITGVFKRVTRDIPLVDYEELAKSLE